MNTLSSKFECPDCGSREIHYEYDSYGRDLMPRIYRQIEDNIPTEMESCYCLRCGVMFDPVQEAFALKKKYRV